MKQIILAISLLFSIGGNFEISAYTQQEFDRMYRGCACLINGSRLGKTAEKVVVMFLEHYDEDPELAAEVMKKLIKEGFLDVKKHY